MSVQQGEGLGWEEWSLGWEEWRELVVLDRRSLRAADCPGPIATMRSVRPGRHENCRLYNMVMIPDLSLMVR